MCTFCFGVSVLIFAMIQDQALVASKHYLIETKENSPGHKQVVVSFKILKNSYFKISKVSFAESFHAAPRSVYLFTYYHCMVDELKLDLKMFRLSGRLPFWPLSKNILNLDHLVITINQWRGKCRVWNDFEMLRGWIVLYWVEQSLIHNNFRRVVKTTSVEDIAECRVVTLEFPVLFALGGAAAQIISSLGLVRLQSWDLTRIQTIVSHSNSI